MKALLKILEILGMIVAVPLVFLWGVHGLVILIGVIWILVSDTGPTPEEMGSLAAIALLIKLIQFLTKKNK